MNLIVSNSAKAAGSCIFRDILQGTPPAPLDIGPTREKNFEVYRLPSADSLPGVSGEQYILAWVERRSDGAIDKFLGIRLGNKDELVELAHVSKLVINGSNGSFDIVRETDEDAVSLLSNQPAQPTKTTEEEPTQHDEDNEELPADRDDLISPEMRKKILRSHSGMTIRLNGHTPESLLEDLGLPIRVSEKVLATQTVHQLHEYIRPLPHWQSYCYFALAVSRSIKQIREELEFTAPDPNASRDEIISKALSNPIFANDFVIAADEDDLKRALESRDFNQWRVYLHNTQKRVATNYFSGSARVFGGAGTGKTVVAVHRTRNLHYGLNSNEPTYKRIVLTTFTRSLAASLKKMLRSLDENSPTYTTEKLGDDGVLVTNIDDLVTKVLNLGSAQNYREAWNALTGVDATDRPSAINDSEERALLKDMVHKYAPELPNDLLDPHFLRDEWVYVLLQNDVKEKIDYLRAPRRGRGKRLSRKERLELWKVFNGFRIHLAQSGKLGWEARAIFASELIDSLIATGRISGTKRLIDHIIIDEAQDFHVGHWKLIRKMVPVGPNDIFISEDGHQRIYRRPITLSHLGIETAGRRSRRLTVNYRTTAENLELANMMLGNATFFGSTGEAESVTDCESLRTGPMPIVRQCKSTADEANLVAKFIQEARANASTPESLSIAILIRTKERLELISRNLAKHGIAVAPVKDPSDVPDENTIPVITMHNAKGLEFSHVIIMDAGYIPPAINMDDPDMARAERSLMYVATSRARDYLLITSSTHRNSYLTELLDELAEPLDELAEPQ